MKLFWKALGDKLRADTGAGSLVTLTGHSSSDIRIEHASRDAIAKHPMLVYSGTTYPFINSATTVPKYTEVEFLCETTTRLTCDGILDRLGVLLDRADQAEREQKYDITDTNIRNLWTRYLSRSSTMRAEDRDVWFGTVTAGFNWFLR